MKIYKYEIPVGHEVDIKMTTSLSILSVISQTRGMVSLYAYDDWQQGKYIVWNRKFVAIGTGQEIPVQADYIATAQDASGPGLIWHVFEIREALEFHQTKVEAIKVAD